MTQFAKIAGPLGLFEGHPDLNVAGRAGPAPRPLVVIAGGEEAQRNATGAAIAEGGLTADVLLAGSSHDPVIARELVGRPSPWVAVVLMAGPTDDEAERVRLTRLLTLLGAHRVVVTTDSAGVRDAVAQTLAETPAGQIAGTPGAAEPAPGTANRFRVVVAWLGETPLLPGRAYEIRVGDQTTTATLAPLRYRLDLETRVHVAATMLEAGEIGVCDMELEQPIRFAPYRERPAAGACRLIDRLDGDLVGVGMIEFALRRGENVRWQSVSVSKADRAGGLGQRATVLWLTGLSGAGKSTLANLVESELHARGCHTYLLDGDNIRHGLNSDLGFTDADRVENVRRVAEVAALMVDAGLIVIASFISPFRAERAMARSLFSEDEFFEIYVDTPLAVAESRDTKGLYGKARRGELNNFTGIDSPYEPPECPELRIDTETTSAPEAAQAVIRCLEEAGRLSHPVAQPPSSVS